MKLLNFGTNIKCIGDEMNIKNILALLFTTFAISTYADTCTIGIATGPGGSQDNIMRTLQKQNKGIQIEYYPGQYSGVAVNKLKQNPEIGLFSNPAMFSSKAAIKDPNIELQKIVAIFSIAVYSHKLNSVDEVLTLKKGTIGLPVLGGGAHIVALELKELNPNLEIVAFGSDVKSIPSILNGDVDIYISAINSAEQLNALKIKTLHGTNELNIAGRRIRSYTWIGLWTSKNATADQKESIVKCFDNALTPEFIKENSTPTFSITNITGSRKDTIFKDYISTVEKYAL